MSKKSNKKQDVHHYTNMESRIECKFWQRVVEELEYQGKQRKWLAKEAHFDVSTIGNGLNRNGMPRADIALNIANALKVPVEYLVFGINNKQVKKLMYYDIETLHKNSKTISELEKLPDNLSDTLKKIISDISSSYTNEKEYPID